MIFSTQNLRIAIPLVIFIFISLTSLAQKNSESDISENSEELIIEYVGTKKMPVSRNLLSSESYQDKLLNLDFHDLKSDKLEADQKSFMNLFNLGYNGKERELIDSLKVAYPELEEGNVKDIVGNMLLEYFNNAGRYKEGVDFLNLKRDNFTSILASFPEEEFLEIEATVHDSLIKSNFDHAIVTANINGHLEELLFDTGADWTLLSESRAKSMGVIMDDFEFDLSTSTSIEVKARVGYIEDFKIGNVQIKNHHVLVLNDESTIIEKDSIRFDVGAIFGWNGIRKLQVVLDDVNKKYSMVPSKRKKESLNNFFWLGYPGLKLVLSNGQALAFGFDSGANKTEITTNILKKLPNLEARKEVIEEGGIGGVERQEVDVIDKASLYLSNHKLTFNDLTALGEGDFFLVNQDGTVGMDILKDNIITIDFINKELKIESGLRQDVIDAIERKLESLSQNFPGYACSIGKDGNSVYSKGFGWRDIENKLPFEDNTTFNLYSISKTFTGVALSMLMETGDIDFEQPILEIDNTLPKVFQSITPRLLVSHMSGVRHYDGDWLQFASRPCELPKEGVRHFANDGLISKPGSKAHYSTYGFVLLSHIIAIKSRSTFENFLKQSIFDVADMNNTYLDGRNDIDSNRAIAYQWNEESQKMEETNGIHNSCKFGGGGYVSSTRDLIKFSKTLLDGRILSDEYFKKFHTPIADPMTGLIENPHSAKDGYAMGIEYHETKIGDEETFFISHGGSSLGGSSYLLIYPKYKISIALGANFDEDGLESVAKEIAEIILNSIK